LNLLHRGDAFGIRAGWKLRAADRQLGVVTRTSELAISEAKRLQEEHFPHALSTFAINLESEGKGARLSPCAKFLS
jgi:hypothetical protein